LSRKHSIDEVSLFDLQTRIKKLKSLDLRNFNLEQVEARLGRIMDAYSTLPLPLVLTGAYRARVNTSSKPFQNVSELWYPPSSAVTKLGRLNKIGEPVFYASNKANVAAIETRPNEGDTVTIMKMLSQKEIDKLQCVEIGLAHSKASEIQHLKADTLPHSNRAHLAMLRTPQNIKKWNTIDSFLSEILLADVALSVVKTFGTVDGVI
jgi:hypothetical protein